MSLVAQGESEFEIAYIEVWVTFPGSVQNCAPEAPKSTNRSVTSNPELDNIHLIHPLHYRGLVMSVVRPLCRLQGPSTSSQVHSSINLLTWTKARQTVTRQARATSLHHVQKQHYAVAPAPTQGSLTENALLRRARIAHAGDATTNDASKDSPPSGLSSPLGLVTRNRDGDSMAARLDPQPRQRRRWERKMIMMSIKRRGRLSKTEMIKRTERQSLTKSEMWQTSMKKLAPLARQIAGKPLREAIVQMQFSKKKFSKPILEQLQQAELTAIVERGMGLEAEQRRKSLAAEKKDDLELSSLPKEHDSNAAEERRPRVEIVDEAAEREQEEREKASKRQTQTADDDQTAVSKTFKPKRITLKDGSRHTVYNPTDLYVAQAWVNKGSYGQGSMKRARGRVDRLLFPQTSKSTLARQFSARYSYLQTSPYF